MNEITIIISAIAILFSTIALITACVGIAMVCGFLRSTHTVAWKPLEATTETDEEAEDSSDYAKLLKDFKNKPRDFAFMDEVAEQNNY